MSTLMPCMCAVKDRHTVCQQLVIVMRHKIDFGMHYSAEHTACILATACASRVRASVDGGSGEQSLFRLRR